MHAFGAHTSIQASTNNINTKKLKRLTIIGLIITNVLLHDKVGIDTNVRTILTTFFSKFIKL